MSEWQGDLFSGSGFSPPARAAVDGKACAALDDDTLSAELPSAGLTRALAIVAEMGRRRSATAIPALERLCRRFAGFGRERVVPEQAAALQALVAIDGREAGDAIARLVADAIMEGPGLTAAVAAVAQLGCTLPAGIVVPLLRRDAPALREAACRCVGRRATPACIAILIDLLGDLHEDVRNAAACALGRLGRREARDILLGMLATAPSAEAIDAIAQIADEDAIVALGRLGWDDPALAPAVIDALDGIDDPRAARIAASLRGAALSAGES